MNRTSKIVIASVLAVGLVGGVAAHSKFRGSHDPAQMAAKIVNKVAKKLELNATQRASLEVLSGELQEARAKMKQDLGMEKEEMINMITADTFDQAKALDIVTAKTNTVQQTAPEIIGALGGFLDTLNAEQKAQIAKHMQKHRRHHGRYKHDDDGNDG